MPIKNKILEKLTSIYLARDKASGGSSTLGAAAAAGATSITVASITGFAANDTFRVGSGEEMELCVVSGTPSGGAIALSEPLVYNHILGEAVVEQTAYDLGDISDGGITVSFTGQQVDVPVATKRLTYTILDGYLDMLASFGLPGITMENFCIMFGIPFGQISGAGTFNSPYAFTTDGNNFNQEQNQSIIAIGARKDGTITRAELWGVDMDYTALSAKMARGAAVSLPVRAVASAGGVMNDNAPAYVADVSKRPNKGKVFDYLSEVGLFLAETAGSPLVTTVDTPTSTHNLAGQNLVNLVAVGTIASGTWLQFGTGDTVEYHRVASVASLVATLADNLFRDQAIGTAVVQQKLVPFAGVSSDGVTVSSAGSVDKIQVATRRLSVGLKSGEAKVTFAFNVIDVSLANFAYALGIPQAQIVSNRLPVNSNIDTFNIAGIYLKGINKDGTTNWINGWGCSQDVSNIAAVFSSKGIQSVPITLRPASGIQFMQHT